MQQLANGMDLYKSLNISDNNIAANAIVAATIGGTASAASGGSFANGAITGAFSRLFNDVATGSSPKAVQPPQRNKGALVFDGDSLDYYNADGELERSWPAVSGNPDSTFSDQWKSNYGPLPEGSYTISPSQTNRDAFYKAGWGNNDAWGDVRTPLNANSGTYTFGRGGFYVHGGAFPGSAGCIDLVKFNNDFHNWFTRQGGPVNVYVSYPRSITVPGH